MLLSAISSTRDKSVWPKQAFNERIDFGRGATDYLTVMETDAGMKCFHAENVVNVRYAGTGPLEFCFAAEAERERSLVEVEHRSTGIVFQGTQFIGDCDIAVRQSPHGQSVSVKCDGGTK